MNVGTNTTDLGTTLPWITFSNTNVTVVTLYINIYGQAVKSLGTSFLPTYDELKVVVENAIQGFLNRTLTKASNWTDIEVFGYLYRIGLMGPLSYIPSVDSIQLTDSEAFLFLGGYI